ncbi:MAG: baseplate J/gp47 family protein, partial [Acidobacteriota bacterium]
EATGETKSWRFARVEESDERALRLAAGPRPAPATEVYRAFAVERGENGLLFPFDFETAARWTGQGFRVLTGSDSTPVGTGYRTLKDTGDLASVMEIFLVPDGAAPVGTVTAVTAGEFTFDGKPGKLGSGQWVVADDGDALWPVRIARITEREDHFVVALEPSATPPHGAGHRPVGDLPCLAVQGIGVEYSKALKEAGIETVQELHGLDAAGLARLEGISPVRRWEMKTKADVLLGIEADAGELAAIADRAPGTVLDLPTEELAELLERPTAAAEELKDRLRMCEACLDHDAFRELRIRDLLPETPARATGAPSGSALPDRLVRLHGLFEHTLRPTGWDRNDTPLTGDRIVLDVARTPRLLAPGRRLVLEREVPPEDGGDPTYTGAVETRVEEVDDAARAVTLDLAEPLETRDGFTLGNAVLRGNVVPAGHGETRPEKVLGSGDAARSNQRFVLREEGVSFVADATQPSGVRAAVTVRVGGRAWEQVANLRDSRPADAHYAIRMTEEGHLAVELGDGRHGRRLPTGGNNVRIRFRVGTGLAGNLAAGSLTKAARPHRLVGAVRQPLAATGGNDMEDVRSLKENAPASVLTLERAVSVSDLSHLAARQSSVWQARAFPVPTALSRRESVEVVVVPPDGGELGDLERTLRELLEANTLPGVDVHVSAAEMTPFHLSVTARVKSAEYDPDQVVESVRRALLDAFSLQRRRLGQDLFLSEIYQVVEGVVGVESSTCAFERKENGSANGGNGPARRLEADPDQVFHLDPVWSDLRLRHEEWTL